MLYRFCWYLAKVLFRILFHGQVIGRHNIDKVKGAILAVNHSSFVDPVFAGAALKRKIYFLARKDLFEFNRSFAWLLRGIHTVPFNRDAPDTRALKNVIDLLQHGNIVLIFPEGTRSPDGNLLPGHAGIGYVALKAGVPIVPMYIKGAHNILPRDAKFIRLAKARIIIGEPIYLDTWLRKERIERSDYQEVADLVMNRIKHLSELTD